MILTTGMAHQRELIRHAVVTLLTGANTAAGSRVVGTRVEPHQQRLLPAISVYTLSESVDQDSALRSPIELTRELKLEITAWVAHADAFPVDDAMDDLAEQIEAAMASDYYIAGTVADQILESTEMQVVEDDGRSDPLVGIVTLTYAITYRTVPADMGVGLDDFLTVNAQQKVIGGVTDTPVAADLFATDPTE